MDWEKFSVGKNPDNVICHQEFLRAGKNWKRLNGGTDSMVLHSCAYQPKECDFPYTPKGGVPYQADAKTRAMLRKQVCQYCGDNRVIGTTRRVSKRLLKMIDSREIVDEEQLNKQRRFLMNALHNPNPLVKNEKTREEAISLENAGVPITTPNATGIVETDKEFFDNK
jgi:hypothetical protein